MNYTELINNTKKIFINKNENKKDFKNFEKYKVFDRSTCDKTAKKTQAQPASKYRKKINLLKKRTLAYHL